MPVEDLTAEEKSAIRALQRLARRWPKTLWLFAGDGAKIAILKTGPDGERMRTKEGGGESVDQNYIVGFAELPNDGGDW